MPGNKVRRRCWSILINPSNKDPVHLWDPKWVITVPAQMLVAKPSTGRVLITNSNVFVSVVLLLNHYGLVTPYGVIDLGQHWLGQWLVAWRHQSMMTSSNGNIFRVTGHLWIPRTKVSDAELWCFLWSAPEYPGWVNNHKAGDLRRNRAHYDVRVMSLLDPMLTSHQRGYVTFT